MKIWVILLFWGGREQGAGGGGVLDIRESRQQENENCKTRKFVICTVTNTSLKSKGMRKAKL